MFHHDHLLQVFKYAFMYVDPETIPEEDHFSDTKTFVDNYKKIKTTGTVPIYLFVLIYIRS